jgi:hypothetical protein
VSDRRRTWVRTWPIRLGRAALSGLTALGSYWCAGYLAASARPSPRPPLDGHGDVEAHAEAVRGVAEIEAFLATVDQPVRRPESPKRPRRRDLP